MSALRTYNYDVNIVSGSGDDYLVHVVASYTQVGDGWVTFKNCEHAPVWEIPEHRVVYIQRVSLVDYAA
jgi:hypothetical protein